MFTITKIAPNNFTHFDGFKEMNFSNWEINFNNTTNTITLQLRNGAPFPKREVLASEVIIKDGIDGTPETFSTTEQIRTRLLALNYNPLQSSVVGSAEWGGIGGDIENQTDLIEKLDEKEFTLLEGTNITIDRTDPLSPIISASGGGGAVDSVNGQTGVVVLDAEDVGAISITETIVENNILIERQIDGIPTEKEMVIIFLNKSDVVGGQDYQNETIVGLKAGTTNNHRRYLAFIDKDDFIQWLNGVNAEGRYILFDSVSNAHRIWMNTSADDGHTYINSVGTGRIYLNQFNDGGDGMGTGGVYIGNGGTSPTTQWFVDSSGRMCSPALTTINTRYSQTLGGDFTDTTSTSQGGLFASVKHLPTANSSAIINGCSVSSQSEGTFNVANINGGVFLSKHFGTGVLTNARGFSTVLQNLSTGTITNAFGVSIEASTVSGGTISTLNGLYLATPTGSGTIGIYYGIRVLDATATSLTAGIRSSISLGGTKWNLYLDGTAKNYINGNLLIGTTTDTGEKLQVNGKAKIQDGTDPSHAVTLGQVITKDNGTTYDTNAIKTVTQAEYDALGTPDATTLYFIV